MKHLLLATLLLPTIACAQESISIKDPISVDMALNIGYCPDNSFQPIGALQSGYIRSSLKGLVNLKHIQTGLTVEGGTLSDDYWYLSPAAIFNYKIRTGKSYFYAGCIIGYIYSKDMQPGHMETNTENGCIYGVQTGYTAQFNKHWAFTSEIGMRIAHLKSEALFFHSDNGNYFSYLGPYRRNVLLLPVSVGMSYKF